MIRRLTLCLASLAMMLSLAPSVANASVGQPATSSSISPMTVSLVTSYCASPEELAVLNLINQYRAQNGLGALSLSFSLSKAAEYHSLDMAQYNYFSHNLADGTTWSQNIVNHGYNYGTWKGENIAAGYTTPQSVFEGWRNSPGHNANLLQPNFTAIGVGLVVQPGTTYTYYWTTTFGGVVDGGATGCDGSSPSTGGGGTGGTGGTGDSAPSSDSGRAGTRPPRGSSGGSTGHQPQPTATPNPSRGDTPSRPPRSR